MVKCQDFLSQAPRFIHLVQHNTEGKNCSTAFNIEWLHFRIPSKDSEIRATLSFLSVRLIHTYDLFIGRFSRRCQFTHNQISLSADFVFCLCSCGVKIASTRHIFINLASSSFRPLTHFSSNISQFTLTGMVITVIPSYRVFPYRFIAVLWNTVR